MKIPSTIHEVPFFRLIVPLVVGIMLQTQFNILSTTPTVIIIPAIGILILSASTLISSKWQYRWIYGFILNCYIFSLGLVLPLNFSFNKSLQNNLEQKVIVRLMDKPELRNRSYRVIGVVEKIIVNQQLKSSNESILLYFNASDTLTSRLSYGDIIAAVINTKAFELSSNPYQFDIKKYMLQEGIRYSCFIKQSGWTKIGNKSNSVYVFAIELRDRLLNLFVANGIQGQELAVVSALTMGYKELLDENIRQVYSSTGAMHILAVSGLHVGILYVFLSFILGFLPNKKIFKLVKLPMILIFLWFFALLTGLSPSVCRAALMLSLIAIGQNFGFRSNIYNTIFAVAFVLLIANPYNIYNLGFQLSFSAVLSIIFFYPYINKLFLFKNKITHYVWSLISVSIAAQIGTLPFTLCAFGQFPLYFILSNILAIPMATGIIYLAILLMLISPIPILASWTGKTLNLLLYVLNQGLKWIEQLPESAITNIHISTVQLMLLIITTIILSLFLINKSIKKLQLIMILLIFVFVLNIGHSIEASKKQIVFFNLPNQTKICIKQPLMATFIDNEGSSDPIDGYEFFIKGYLTHQTINGKYNHIKIDSCATGERNQNLITRRKHGIAFIKFENKIIAYPYNDSTKQLNFGRKIDVDFLVANKYFTTQLLDFICPNTLIIDPSTPKYKAEKAQILLANSKTKIHNLKSDGAYWQTLQ